MNQKRPKKFEAFRFALHAGLEIISRFDIAEAARLFVEHLYQGVSSQKVSKIKTARNESIRQRYEAGETLGELAVAYSISEQRVHQIVHNRRK